MNPAECLHVPFLQARQVLEREFNNLLALGTDRRLEEVTGGSSCGFDLTQHCRKETNCLTSLFRLVPVERR